jgi:serine/threonine protein kinase
MAHNNEDLVGKTIGPYTLERLLGQGGMGAVYLAQQTRPARQVAVKILQPHLAPSSQVYAEFLARFRREADVVAQLEHVNIIPIYDYGERDGLAYLVMPYIRGGSLRDVLSKRGALPVQEILPYADQIASALDYAHAHDVIHRDLKPANFLLHTDGRIMLADFGIARIMEESHFTTGPALTHTGMMLGTPEYMAPEMARGESLDYRADIYEFGVVLFQMLSGRAPFSGNTPYAVAVKHIQEPLPPLHQMNPAIPAVVDAVLQKATAKRREDRYPSAGAVAQALREGSIGQGRYQADDQQNSIPTLLSEVRPPIASPPPAHAQPSAQEQVHSMPPILNTLPAQHPQTPASMPAWVNAAPTPGSYRQSDYQAPTNTPYPPVPHRQQPWWVIIALLLALVLVVGGVLIGLQLNRGTSTTNSSSTPTTVVTSQPTVQTTPTTAPTPTATSTQATPTTAITPTPTTASTSVPVGKQIYATSSPGYTCDRNGGTWSDYNGVNITCQGGTSRITNTAQADFLQGTFLTGLAGTYPSNYVVQAQLQQEKNSSSDFGLYFRNQPGKQQGVYTLLIHPDGTWNTYVYDNNTGAPTKLTGGGSIGDIHALVTLAVVVKGQQFSFYANGKLLGSVSDATYSSGTAGIAVDRGGSIIASNFNLYTTI